MNKFRISRKIRISYSHISDCTKKREWFYSERSYSINFRLVDKKLRFYKFFNLNFLRRLKITYSMDESDFDFQHLNEMKYLGKKNLFDFIINYN